MDKIRFSSSTFFLVLGVLAVLLQSAPTWSAEKTEKVVISGGTAGGAWSAVTEGIAEALRQSVPAGSTVSSSTGTDAANFLRLEKGSSDLALGVSSTGLSAIEGKEPFKTRLKNIRAVTALFDEPFQFVILTKTGIRDFSDIKAKQYKLRHSPNRKGNFMEVVCEKIFEQYGFDYKALEGWGGKIFYNSYSESINLIRTDSLDSLSGCSPLPTTQFVELSGTHDIAILPLSEKAINAINTECGTIKMVIPAGTYKFLKADVPTIAARNILACKAELPDDLVYRITKAIYEKRGYLATVHVVLKGLDASMMPVTKGVPLHPGAEKFYKEIKTFR